MATTITQMCLDVMLYKHSLPYSIWLKLKINSHPNTSSDWFLFSVGITNNVLTAGQQACQTPIFRCRMRTWQIISLLWRNSRSITR